MEVKDNNPHQLVLYRGETPGATGFDLHGGYGETWTIDPDHAQAYAEGPNAQLKQALLPTGARRLILVDPLTNDYNWSDIETLARLIDNPFLSDALRSGWQIYDLWRSEWTLRLKEAGYDSLATVGIEGPEEYVLDPSKLILLKTLPTNITAQC